MLSLLGITSPPEAKKLGDLKDNKNISEQLHDLKGKVETTMTKNKSELKKYRELSKFNENLTKSYVANLKIIVDISNLLGSYNEFFELFKSKLSEIDEELGLPISSDDFDYLKKLTTEQMVQLDDVFKKETGNLKKLYVRYGKQKEFDEVETAEKLFDNTKASGQVAYNVLKTPVLPQDMPTAGGAFKSKAKAPKRRGPLKK
jgi:hypothetical protein